MKKITNIFLIFLKIGVFTFGGGYTMITLLRNEFVSKKQWIISDLFLDMVAIAESTPGPIAINSATYIGYHIAGFNGALVATTAVCIPSFTIIYIISSYFDSFLKLSYVSYAFDGIQACVVYLIISAAIQMLAGVRKTFFNLVIVSTIFITMLIFSVLSIDFSTVFYILICGMIGVARDFIKLIPRGENKK
ncbi:MAG: chromate transporter [Lachnospiraceae bacterium]|nr:chromate transporter [Lachnospiraceae bacterium]